MSDYIHDIVEEKLRTFLMEFLLAVILWMEYPHVCSQSVFVVDNEKSHKMQR